MEASSAASTQDTDITIEEDEDLSKMGSPPEEVEVESPSVDVEIGGDAAADQKVNMDNNDRISIQKESPPLEAEEDCPICYETFSDQLECHPKSNKEDESLNCHDQYVRQRLRLEDCGHEFCRECFVNHCKHAVSVRGIPICCPAKSAAVDCSVVLPEKLIEELLCDPRTATNGALSQYGSISNSAATTTTTSQQHDPHEKTDFREWNRYLRFKRLVEDPTLVSCTTCHELMSIEENHASSLDGEEDKNTLMCPSCGHVFCSIHGDAHTGKACNEYKPPTNRQIRKSEKIIRKFTKPCSHCGVPIQKESGCDHIVCISCQDDMCFRCGTHEHLIGDMVRSCKQCEQNFIDHRHIWKYRFTICLGLPLYLPLCLIHVVVMTALTVASFGCFCCFGCGMNVDAKGDPTFHPKKGVRTVFGIVFLPIIDLFRQCGLPCCWGLDEIPDIDLTKTAETFFDDNDDDGDDDMDDDDNADIEV